MIYDDLNTVEVTGRVLKVEVRQIKKQFLFVIRIAVNKSYPIDGVIKRSSTVIEGQKWLNRNPQTTAERFTVGLRVGIKGELKLLEYKTRDGRYHKVHIIDMDKFYILEGTTGKSKEDNATVIEYDEELKEDLEKGKNFDVEDSELEEIINSPLF